MVAEALLEPRAPGAARARPPSRPRARASAASVCGPDARQPLDRKRREEARAARSAATRRTPRGPGLLGGELRDELAPARCRRAAAGASSLAHALAQPRGERLRRLVSSRRRRGRPPRGRPARGARVARRKQARRRPATLAVARACWCAAARAPRAALERLEHRHADRDARGERVARRRLDEPALARVAADDHRAAGERRVGARARPRRRSAAPRRRAASRRVPRRTGSSSSSRGRPRPRGGSSRAAPGGRASQRTSASARCGWPGCSTGPARGSRGPRRGRRRRSRSGSSRRRARRRARAAGGRPTCTLAAVARVRERAERASPRQAPRQSGAKRSGWSRPQLHLLAVRARARPRAASQVPPQAACAPPRRTRRGRSGRSGAPPRAAPRERAARTRSPAHAAEREVARRGAPRPRRGSKSSRSRRSTKTW